MKIIRQKYTSSHWGTYLANVDGNTKIADPGDTVFIPGGKEREIRNETNEVVIMNVVMPYPPKDN